MRILFCNNLFLKCANASTSLTKLQNIDPDSIMLSPTITKNNPNRFRKKVGSRKATIGECRVCARSFSALLGGCWVPFWAQVDSEGGQNHVFGHHVRKMKKRCPKTKVDVITFTLDDAVMLWNTWGVDWSIEILVRRSLCMSMLCQGEGGGAILWHPPSGAFLFVSTISLFSYIPYRVYMYIFSNAPLWGGELRRD